MNKRATPLLEAETPIHRLTDDCLSQILTLVGNGPLPIARPKYRELRVTHTLQCALVCKRWHACTRPAVHSLSVANRALGNSLLTQAHLFTGLRRLIIPGGPIIRGFLPALAAATPYLELLRLEIYQCSNYDLAQALPRWTRVKQLTLYSGTRVSSETHSVILDSLVAMTSVEHLNLFVGLDYNDYDKETTWERLLPHTRNLKFIALTCRGVPPLSMTSIPCINFIMVGTFSLSPTLFRFTNLAYLHLIDFFEKGIPEALGDLSQLKNLYIQNAPSISTLPKSLGRLLALEGLKLEQCKELRLLPDSLGDLPKLRDLHVIGCTHLARLPDSVRRLTSLEELVLEGAVVSQGLPKALEGMRRLKDLRVAASHNIEHLPETLGELSRLAKLTLEDLPSLRAVPDCVGRLRGLREIRLVGLLRMEALPESVGDLRSVEKIYIDACGFSSLPASLGNLSRLTSLLMTGCNQLGELPESMGGLCKLQQLTIERSGTLACLPEGIKRLTELTELIVRKCECFVDEKGVISRIGSLRYLVLAGCRQENLPDGLGKLTALVNLVKCSLGAIEHAREVHCYPERILRTLGVDAEAQVIDGDDDESLCGRRIAERMKRRLSLRARLQMERRLIIGGCKVAGAEAHCCREHGG